MLPLAATHRVRGCKYKRGLCKYSFGFCGGILGCLMRASTVHSTVYYMRTRCATICARPFCTMWCTVCARLRNDFFTPVLHDVAHCVCTRSNVTLFSRNLWQLRVGCARTVGDSNTGPVCMHCACMACGTPSTASNCVFFFLPPGTDFPRCRGYHCTHTG